MSAPRTDPDAASLDGLRILARLVAEAWRNGGLPPDASEAELRRRRRLPITATLVPAPSRS